MSVCEYVVVTYNKFCQVARGKTSWYGGIFLYARQVLVKFYNIMHNTAFGSFVCAGTKTRKRARASVHERAQGVRNRFARVVRVYESR